MTYGFALDLKKCIGCRACELACAKKNNYFYGFRKVMKKEVISENNNFLYFLSLSCNHCENPVCLRVCPERLYNKRRDGIVIHNFGRCKGCTECVQACPYNAPKYNYVIGKVSKCNLCLDLLENDYEPKCVNACITKALQVVKQPEKSLQKMQCILGIEAHITQPSLELIIPEFLRMKERRG